MVADAEGLVQAEHAHTVSGVEFIHGLPEFFGAFGISQLLRHPIDNHADIAVVHPVILSDRLVFIQYGEAVDIQGLLQLREIVVHQVLYDRKVMERKSRRGALGHALLLAHQGQRILIRHQAEGDIAMPQVLFKAIGGTGLHDSVHLVKCLRPQLILFLDGQRLFSGLLQLSADGSDPLKDRILLCSLVNDNIGKQMVHIIPPTV